MKHLRKFNESSSNELKPMPGWDKYVKDLFNQYMSIWDEDCEVYDDDIIQFFNYLQEEIDNSEDIDIWAVDVTWGKGYKHTTTHTMGLARAYGACHACLKLALELKNPDLIGDSTEAYIVEEDTIQDHINRAKEEIKKWETIY